MAGSWEQERHVPIQTATNSELMSPNVKRQVKTPFFCWTPLNGEEVT